MNNNLRSERVKEQVYWNCFAFDHLSSLTQLVDHNQKPSQYTQRDYDWRDFFFTNRIHRNGQVRPQTFIQRCQNYFQNDQVFNKLTYLNTQEFQLNVIKYEFWNQILNLKSTSEENHQSKNEVKSVLMKKRIPVLIHASLFAGAINFFTGIKKLSFQKQFLTFFLLGAAAETIIRFKMSSQIFYDIPTLPSKSLEEERIQIMNQCIIFDGTINSYDKNTQLQNYYYKKALETAGSEQKRQQIMSIIGFNVIKMSDL